MHYKTAFIVRFKRAWGNILAPGCLLGPAIWLSNSESSRIHRRVCRGRHSSRGSILPWIIFIVKVALWYALLVWVSLVITLLIDLKRIRQDKANESYDSTLRRIGLWAYLGFWLGAKPQAYFRLRLYASPPKQWLNSAFPQEQSNWHNSLGYRNESSAKIELADKQITEERLHQNGVPCVNTVHILARGKPIDDHMMYTKQHYFIKPKSLNAMRGCARLNYQSERPDYQLTGYDLQLNPIAINGEQNINAYLQQLSSQVELLVQTMLTDHEQLSSYSDDRDISTLRIITCRFNEHIHVVHAMLEVAIKHTMHWARYDVDVATGILQLANDSSNDAEFPSDFTIPFWPRACKYVQDAHRSFDLIKTVSWDVCISPEGPVIIEGNSGWGLSAPQTTSQRPLLQGTLGSAYTLGLKNHNTQHQDA